MKAFFLIQLLIKGVIDVYDMYVQNRVFMFINLNSKIINSSSGASLVGFIKGTCRLRWDVLVFEKHLKPFVMKCIMVRKVF